MRDEPPLAAWKRLPFAYIFAKPDLGLFVSDRMILFISCLFIVMASYVFLRGDDGYTSGAAGMTLPHLLRFLIRLVTRICMQDSWFQNIFCCKKRSTEKL